MNRRLFLKVVSIATGALAAGIPDVGEMLSSDSQTPDLATPATDDWVMVVSASDFDGANAQDRRDIAQAITQVAGKFFPKGIPFKITKVPPHASMDDPFAVYTKFYARAGRGISGPYIAGEIA